MLEVGDRRAFAQEFGVGRDRHALGAFFGAGSRSIWSPVPTGTVDLVTTTVPGLIAFGKLADGVEHIGQIGMAIAAPRRRADRDEHRLGSLHSLGEVGREVEPAALDIGLDQRLEPRLPDRHLAGIEAVDLVLVLVDAGHMVAEIGEAGARHEPDIAGADHRDAHVLSRR